MNKAAKGKGKEPEMKVRHKGIDWIGDDKSAALGAALESIAHDSMLISRLRHSPPTRWRGA